MSGVLAGLVDSLKLFGKTGFQLGKGFIIDESGKVIQPSDISGAKVGYPSNVVNQVQSLPRTVNPNLVIGTAGALGTTGFLAITATNPGVQQTAQSFSSGFNSLAQSGNNITSFLTSSPYGPILLVGGLIILGVVVFKK